MFNAGRLAIAIAFLLLLSLEGALGCQHNEPCLCGLCNDLDECVPYVEPDPGSDPDPNFPVPVTYQLQICDVNAIEVAFDDCNKKMLITSDENGVFDIAPISPGDMMDYGCSSHAGPVTLRPHIDVHFDNKAIQVGASCSEELYYGKLFGENDEIRLVGSCIRDASAGVRCHTDNVAPCGAGETELPTGLRFSPSNRPSSPRAIDGGGSCPRGKPCLCGTCKDSCGPDDVNPVLSCGAGCQYDNPAANTIISIPVAYELQICYTKWIQVKFRDCNRKVPFTSENGVFFIKPPSSFTDKMAYQCPLTWSIGLKPYIDIWALDQKKHIRVDASCSEPLYHGQFFGESREIRLVGSCVGDGTVCNSLDVAACGIHGLATCVSCTDRPTQWMESAGKDCATATRVIQKQCNASDRWASENYCQRSCFEAGRGYDGVVCCE